MSIPKLRFKEFNNSWTSNKLGNYFNILMCKRIFSDQTSPIGDIPFYKIGTIGNKADAFISKELFYDYKSKFNYPRNGDIMMTCAGTVGRCWRFDGNNSYYQDSNIVWLSNNNNNIISDDFLFHIILNLDWSKLNKTTITRIYNDDIRNLKLNYPNINEQQKIAAFLSLVDKKISLQEKKIALLKDYKKGLYNVLIVNNDKLSSNIITMRKAVDESLIVLSRGNVIPKTNSGHYPVYSSSIKNDGLMSYIDAYDLDEEIITWSIDGGGNFFHRKKHKFSVTNVSGIVRVNTRRINYLYLYEFLNYQHSYFKFDYSNKAHPSVIEDLYKISLPSVEVQNYYAKFFERVNDKIKSSNDILIHLEKLKKSFLQQMFV